MEVKWQVVPVSFQVAGGGVLLLDAEPGAGAWYTVILPTGVVQVTFPGLLPFPPRTNGATDVATGPVQTALVKLSGALGLLLFRFAAAAEPVTVAVSVSVPVMTDALGLALVVVLADVLPEDEHPARAAAKASAATASVLRLMCTLPLRLHRTIGTLAGRDPARRRETRGPGLRRPNAHSRAVVDSPPYAAKVRTHRRCARSRGANRADTLITQPERL